MEPMPGVFVSTTATDEWAPDPGVPGTDVHVVVDADGISAGMTRMLTVDGPLLWTPDRRETVLVLGVTSGSRPRAAGRPIVRSA